MQVSWAIGVTTVPERMASGDYNQTLHSLRMAGFEQGMAFIDGDDDVLDPLRRSSGITVRNIRIRPYGNWLLGIVELYLSRPNADRYLMVQDDVKLYPHLREYLEALPIPEKGYWNLYTSYPANEDLVWGAKVGWMESAHINEKKGLQTGKGALALCFSREGVVHLLSQRHLYERVQDETFGWRSIDGAVVTAMNHSGWKEYIHNPTLVQHTGDDSTIFFLDGEGNKVKRRHPRACTWRGDAFDARRLLCENPATKDKDWQATG